MDYVTNYGRDVVWDFLPDTDHKYSKLEPVISLLTFANNLKWGACKKCRDFVAKLLQMTINLKVGHFKPAFAG